MDTNGFKTLEKLQINKDYCLSSKNVSVDFQIKIEKSELWEKPTPSLMSTNNSNMKFGKKATPRTVN